MSFIIDDSEIKTIIYDNDQINNVNFCHNIVMKRRHSAKEWLEDGYTTSGVYSVYLEGVGFTDVYCDMTTNGGGWMLVGSWDNASEWTKTSVSSNNVFESLPKNAFSSNFGDTDLNQMRISVSDSIDTLAHADFKYNWNDKLSWKSVWAPSKGINNGYTSPTVRQSLHQFNNSFNIKLNYSTSQTYANISDWGLDENSKDHTANWWLGLTQPGVNLGVYSLSSRTTNDDKDGSFAIAAIDQSDNSGQDTLWNTKIGYDDGNRYIGIGQSSTENNEQQAYRVDVESKLWLWIR